MVQEADEDLFAWEEKTAKRLFGSKQAKTAAPAT